MRACSNEAGSSLSARTQRQNIMDNLKFLGDDGEMAQAEAENTRQIEARSYIGFVMVTELAMFKAYLMSTMEYFLMKERISYMLLNVN